MNLNTATTFRRMACGLLLLVGPAMILVGSIVDPAAGEEDASRGYYEALADDPDKTQIASALYIWGFALTAIGIVGLVHVIRRRGVTLANIGGALAIVGMIMFCVLWATLLHDLNNAEHLGAQTAERLTEDLVEGDYWAPYVVFIPAFAGVFLGFILLGAAIIRSKVAHLAAAVLIVVGIVVVVAGESSKAINVVGNVLLLGGWGLVGLKLLGMKDEQWEGRPA
jgi:hypothetical protein